jgi:hypothetical protein
MIKSKQIKCTFDEFFNTNFRMILELGFPSATTLEPNSLDFSGETDEKLHGIYRRSTFDK